MNMNQIGDAKDDKEAIKEDVDSSLMQTTRMHSGHNRSASQNTIMVANQTFNILPQPSQQH